MDIFSSVTIEGQIISAEVLSKLKQEGTAYQKPEDFGFTENQKLRDEIQFAYSQARKQWSIFKDQAERLTQDETGTSETRRYWILPLLGYLGYNPEHSTAEIVNNRSYAISHRDNDRNGFPIHIMGIHDNIDKKRDIGGPRLSPHGLVQEYLNMTEHLFGLVSNGYKLRLLRDSSRFSRLSFVEFDLQAMMEDELYSDFAVMYRLIHASRMPIKPEDSADSIIEHYHQDAIESGARIREKLRAKVEQTLQMLGNGFLNHPANQSLRQEFFDEDMDASAYYGKLLKIIYRFLFLMVIEERKLVFPKKEDIKGEWNEEQLKEYREIYEKYYSIHRLRNLAEKRHQLDTNAEDLWEQLKKTFQLFEKESMGSRMGIQALNGDLFSTKALDPLDECSLKNNVLLRALDAIARFENENGQMTRVNYGALDVEEFGSVYESLLDHEPIVDQGASSEDETEWSFRFSEGTERKTTGSYYTRPELVQELVKSALEPVIEERLEKAETDEEKVRELLSLKVCDPAAGSGHFLLAAARKISDHLVVARYGEDYSLMEQRLAMREVVKHCIYGVDLNPMAVELCKVALWLESYSVGLPLTFLDHHVKNGNSLVGVDDLKRLNEGIPDGAFKEVLGDVKEVARKLKKRNKKEREKGKQTELQASTGTEEIALEKFADRLDEIDAMPERTIEETTQKKLGYESFKKSRELQQAVTAANIWTGAFFIEKTEEYVDKKLIATSSGLHSYIANPKGSYPPMTAKMDALAVDRKFFHWPLEYPEVFTNGGFDVILGNPPWEKINLKDEEFFSQSYPDIANASTKSKRKKLIEKLRERDPDEHSRYLKTQRYHDNLSKIFRKSGLYPLTGVSRVNLYSVFAELSTKIVNPRGYIGFVIASGLTTDDNNKDFFEFLMQNKQLKYVWDFENREGIFPGVDSRYKFCLFCASGSKIENYKADVAFFLTSIKQIEETERHFSLNEKELQLLNPNTKTLPTFRWQKDAEIVLGAHKKIKAWCLQNEKEDWPGKPKTPFNISNDSDLMFTESELITDGSGYSDARNCIMSNEKKFLPLYESKFIHQYNHRYSSFEGCSDDEISNGNSNELGNNDLTNINNFIKPRYWLEEKISENRYPGNWFLVYRMITRSTDERTSIATIIPKRPCSNSLTIITGLNAQNAALLCANMNTFILDFIARQKIPGTNFNHWIWKQLPFVSPNDLSEYNSLFKNQSAYDWILNRVIELIYTSEDLKKYAEDFGYDGKPFIWDDGRRILLKSELDAFIARLYGLNREDLEYVLNTFTLVKKSEKKYFNEFRSKKLILEAWDRLEKGEPMMSEDEGYEFSSDNIEALIN